MAALFVALRAQNDDNGNSSADIAVTLNAAPTPGNRLVVLVQNEDQAVASITYDGNTISTPDRTLHATSPNFSKVFSAPVVSGSTSLTITKGAAGNRPTTWIVFEISGVDAGSPVDAANDASGVATTWTGPSVTAAAGALVISTINLDENYAIGFDSPFTEIAEQGATGGGSGTPHMAVAYREFAAGGSINATGTRGAGASSQARNGIISYKPAAAAAVEFLGGAVHKAVFDPLLSPKAWF